MPSKPNNRLLHAARLEVERRRSSTPLDADPVAVLQEVLDGAVADLRYAQEQVDQLHTDEVFRETVQGVVPNEWIRLRDTYREELERIAHNLVRAGIADRAVNLRLAQAGLVVQSIQLAAAEIGIPQDQVRELGAALRRRLDESPATAETAAELAPLHLRSGEPAE